MFKNTRRIHFTLLRLIIPCINGCRFTDHSPDYLVNNQSAELCRSARHATQPFLPVICFQLCASKTSHDRRFHMTWACPQTNQRPCRSADFVSCPVNHSCVRSSKLELVVGSSHSITWRQRNVCLAEGLDMFRLGSAASSWSPHGACVVHHRTDKVLVKQHTISDGQTSPVVK
jgi:hypothetical protein